MAAARVSADNPGAPNKRRVTALTYLNPEWKEGDGGELQIVPFLSRPVTLPPLVRASLLT